jgi:hypothetical protein
LDSRCSALGPELEAPYNDQAIGSGQSFAGCMPVFADCMLVFAGCMPVFDHQYGRIDHLRAYTPVLADYSLVFQEQNKQKMRFSRTHVVVVAQLERGRCRH